MALVRRSRIRLVLVVQTVLIIIALTFVWGWLGDTQTLLAWVISCVLVVAELVLLVAYLLQPVPTSETGARPISDTATELVLEDPAGGTITLDRAKKEILSRDASVRVPIAQVRSVMVEAGTDSKLMLTLARDLVVLSEMSPCTPREVEHYRSIGQLLARAAAVPFEDGGG
jgi:hypothetical protein